MLHISHLASSESHSPKPKVLKMPSVFRLIPPEITDQIYGIVGEGNVTSHTPDRRVALPGTSYDSLASFDVYLREEQIPCTIMCSHEPYEFTRRYRRKGRGYHGDIPVLAAIPPDFSCHTTTTSSVPSLGNTLAARIGNLSWRIRMLPYLTQNRYESLIVLRPWKSRTDTSGDRYYEAILQQKTDYSKIWQWLLSEKLEGPPGYQHL